MAAKKTKTNSSLWEKVHVVGGDPCLCRLYVAGIVEDIGRPSTRRYDRGGAVKTGLTGFVFSEPADAVIITDPSAEQLKLCQSVIEDGTLTASALIIVTPGDVLDARMGFAQQAKKHKRSLYLDPIDAGDKPAVRSHVKDWAESTGTAVEAPAIAWITDNAPTRVMKVKTDKGKRDSEVYDLDWLENELDKAAAVSCHQNSAVSLQVAQAVMRFDQGLDTWRFVEYASKTSDPGALLTMFHRLSTSNSSQGAMMVLLSQIEFLIGVRGLLDRGVSNADDIAERMSLDRYIGRYLSQEWEDIGDIPEPTPVNSWRVRKAIESGVPAMARLSSQFQAIVASIRDLRSGLPEDIIYPYLSLALTGKASYSEPLKRIF